MVYLTVRMTTPHHPEYGQRLTRSQKVTLFGESHDDDYKGIVQREGKVVWILVKTGAQQTYPNEVTSTHVKYCYSRDGKANTAMKRAYESGHSFIVKVVPDKAPDTYLWGYGIIEQLQEDYESNGRMYRRFVIKRSLASSTTAVEPVVAPPCVAPSIALPVAIPVAPSIPPSEILADVSERDPKRQCGSGAVLSIERLMEGVQFDSHLEKRHAAMMTALNINWSRTAPTIHGIELGSGATVSYTPDFVVDIPNGVITQTYLIEIKPCYPYDDEIRKCMGACKQIKVMPLFLFYNSDFRCPFAERWNGSGHGDYAHHSGVRAMKFSWNSQVQRVIIEHDAAYVASILSDGSVVAGIDTRISIGDTRFDNEIVNKAYSIANAV